MASRFRTVREIDFPDLLEDRKRHEKLAWEAFKKEHGNLIEALGLDVLSHDPNAPFTVQLPLLPEHEFVYAPPFQQGEGSGSSQEGQEGEGEGAPDRGEQQTGSVPRNRQIVEGSGLERGDVISQEGGRKRRGQQQEGDAQGEQQDAERGQQQESDVQGEQQDAERGQQQEGDAQGEQQDAEQGQQQEGDVQGQQQGRVSAGPRAGKGHEPLTLEAKIDIDDIARREFEELKLPNLRDVALPFFERLRRGKPRGHRKRGPWSRRNLFKSARERLSRVTTMFQGNEKKKKSEPFWEDDIKFRFYDAQSAPAINIVVVIARDKSGSINEEIRRWMRSFLWDLELALHTLWPGVTVVFVLHDERAEEVGEKPFFYAESKGGTYCSSAAVKISEVLERYPRELFNRVVMYLSDGENHPDDKQAFQKAMYALLPETDFFGYLEVRSANEYNFAQSVVMNTLTPFAKRFRHVWVGPAVLGRERLVEAAHSLIRFCQEREEERDAA